MKKLFVTTVLSLSLLIGGIFPQGANAQLAVVEAGPNLITNTINTAKAISSELREYVLDGLAWELANQALEQMTDDIVTWINSGFNGSPAFIQDPGRFFTNIADQVAGRFLEEIGGGFLCSPFSADIRIALEIGYYSASGRSDLQDRYACRFTDAIDNVEAFLDNQFSGNALRNLFEITARPQNNPYLLALDLQQELDGRIFGQLEGERQLLNWNGGFLSRRECLADEEEPNCTGDIITPGDTIQNQLNDSLGIGRDRLLVADDINEIIGALMNQLVSQALGGARGLVGVSTSGGGSSSYFDRTRNPSVNAEDQEAFEERLNTHISDGNSAVLTLDRALSSSNQIVNIVSSARGGNCSASDSARLSEIEQDNALLRTDIITLQNRTEDGVRSLQILIGDLLASNSQSEYLNIVERYQTLVQNGRVPTEATRAEARSLQAQVEALRTEAQTIRTNCGA